MNKIIIYTDGACSGNPGPGGWGAIIDGQEISGFDKNTTNNKMEMQAVIEAVKLVKAKPAHLVIHSDSALVINAFNLGWLVNWQKNNWKGSAGPVKNKELWVEMLELLKPFTYEFVKVKGHSDDELNNRADFLATNEISKNRA